MSRYAIAFFSDAHGNMSRLVEADSRDAALRVFFESYNGEYTRDGEGFVYFREDFDDSEKPMGSILEIPL